MKDLQYKVTGGMKRKRQRNMIFYCCMLAFPVAQFLVFYIYVNFNSILLSFRRFNADGTFTFCGFENFAALFSDIANLPELRYGMRNTFIVYAFNLVVGILTGLLFSYYIYKKRFAAGFFKVVLFMPSVISSVVIVSMFKMFADSFVPTLINQIFGTNMLGLLTEESTVFGTLLFYGLWLGLGTPILMYLGAMNNISESTIEAAQIDGATPLKEFFYIVLPQIFPTVIVFITSGLAGIFLNQFNLYTFYGNLAEPRVYTVGYFMYLRLVRSSGYANYPYVAAMGLLITLVTTPVVLLVRRLLNKIDPMGDKA